MTFRSYPKIGQARNHEYLRFIRTKRSLKSDEPGTKDDPIVPAHQTLGFGITGGKPSDYWAVPLLYSEHTSFKESEHQIGNKTFWKGINVEKAICNYINEFFYLKSQGYKF